MKNAFSRTWYETFLDPMPPERTDEEIAFVERQLPVESFRSVLDLCCGSARHAKLLSEDGYYVRGIDINEEAIRAARVACPDARFDVLDMRAVGTLGGPFDAVVNLWHSFGYFADETHLDILRQINSILRPGGRAIFDLYTDGYLAQSRYERVTPRGGRQIRTTHHRKGQRLTVKLEYDGLDGDVFDWRLYSPAEFEALCVAAGFEILLACTRFSESTPVSDADTRMQFVVARAGT